MANQKHKELRVARIITNVADVPEGWVRIADLTDSVTDQKILSDAHNSDVIPAVKLVRTTSEFRIGPVWVDPAAARSLLDRCQAKRVCKTGTKEVADSAIASFSGDRDALHRIADALERMAEAWGK
jgi:hypothetical protein